MKCNICKSELKKIFSGKILSKYDIDYYFCPECEHLQTQEPFWLDEAYSKAICAQDTGIMKRNLNNSVIITAIICSFFNKGAKFLDYGGGYGVLTRLMRDVGLDFVLYDKYAENLFAIGFEYNKEDNIELLCAFEVLEHFSQPMEELEKMFKISDNILFSEEILPTPPPALDIWWYYAQKTEQHISFYSKKTLEYIASKFNKQLLSYGEYHLFTSKDISNEAFAKAIQNDGLIYADCARSLKSKVFSDMNYIISKNI